MRAKILVIFPLLVALNACQSLEGPPIVEVKDLQEVRVAASATRVTPAKVISFSDAVLMALQNNPGLKPFSSELRASDGRILQAFLRPNPTLDGEIENILGSESYRGFDAAESTLAVSQLIERGGKRAARREVEVADKALVLSDYEIARREVFTEVARAFALALAAQEQVVLYDGLVRLNESFVPAIEKRIEAGKVTAVERTRAQTAVIAARLLKLQAERQFRVARLRLAATWGSTIPVFERVAGRLGALPSPADQASLERRLYAHPAYRRDEKAISKSEADHRLAIANGVQDVTVQGGLRHFTAADNDAALVVGFSIPLPFSNRNQGAIAATGAEIEAARKRRTATMLGLRARLNASVQILNSIRREVATIEKDLLPGAEEAFNGVEEGYRKGRFGYLDLIDASRSLTEAQVQLLGAKAAYQVAAADIAGLTAPLPGTASSK